MSNKGSAPKNNKTVGIVSLYGNTNYGNKLQNYAVVRFFKQFGFDAIILKTPFLYMNDHISFKRYIRLNPLTNLLRRYKIMRNKQHLLIPSDPLMRKRYDNFLEFAKKHLVEETDITDQYNIFFKKHPYDYYVAGSDQIWNYKFGTLNCLCYLRFVPHKKRLSISASLGGMDIPKNAHKLAYRYLNGMRILTVREKSGQELIKKITGKDATVLLDPTLLIDEKEWLDIEQKPDCNIPKKYIFTYFLGQPSLKTLNSIEKFARDNGCEIVAMNDKRYPDYFVLNPSNFVYLIHHAHYVITDSFHGTAFSVIYRKNFWVLDRGGQRAYMLTRVTTLLDSLNIPDRLVDDEHLREKDIDYEKIEGILKVKRQKAKQLYLDIFNED